MTVWIDDELSILLYNILLLVYAVFLKLAVGNVKILEIFYSVCFNVIMSKIPKRHTNFDKTDLAYF